MTTQLDEMLGLNKCHICKSTEHRSRDCPDRCECGMYHTSAEHRCCICGLVGFSHEAKDCPEICKCGMYHTSAEHRCFICNSLGYTHDEFDCPERCHCGLFHKPSEHKPSDDAVAKDVRKIGARMVAGKMFKKSGNVRVKTELDYSKLYPDLSKGITQEYEEQSVSTIEKR